MNYIIGIDIGGTAIKYALFDSCGTMYQNDSIPTNKHGDHIVDDLISIIEQYQNTYTIDGIGISVPGTPDDFGNMILGGAIKDFYNFPLKEKLSQRVNMEITIENDANCVALAEKWVGNGKDMKDFLCITFGTGVGGAIIFNDTLCRGYQNMAGEFGLMLVQPTSQDDYIYSSFNYYGSIPYGLMRLYETYAKRKAKNGIEVYELKNQQDETANKAVQEYIHAICIGLMNLSGILSPESILLGGSISQNKQFVKDIQTEFQQVWQKHSHIKMRTPPKILPCYHTAFSGCYGAAYQVICKLHKQEEKG